MSVENALRFLAEVRRNKALQDRLQALSGRAALDSLAAIGAEAGFAFTVEDYRSAVVASAGGELSDESLREVLRELNMAPGALDAGRSGGEGRQN